MVNFYSSVENKLFHQLKTQFNINKIQGSDWQRDLLIMIGILEGPKNRPLTYKHSIVNKKELNEVKHTESNHPWALQKSRYLLIESNEDRLIDLAKM